MRFKNLSTRGLCLLVCFAALRLPACGPSFPNSLLIGGDAALLAGPVGDFRRELERMNVEPPGFRAVTATNGYAEESALAEISDLRLALQQMGAPAAATDQIVARHLAARKQLQEYLEARRRSNDIASLSWSDTVTNEVPARPGAPEFPALSVVQGLPAEFGDYFSGVLAFENASATNRDRAREAWEAVLELPAAKRQFKSTWAAFMLGKLWTKQDPGRAIAYFQQVRAFARAGFADSCGLAAASIGLEAQVELRRQHFEKAIEFYLSQLVTGDSTAINSLRSAAAAALTAGQTTALKELAANPKTQRVLTAYLISRRSSERTRALADQWLAAVEGADVKDVESAEALALAAYQSGAWDAAQRWVLRARPTPVTQWLQAKLWLRAGKIDEASAMLANVSRMFPLDGAGTNCSTDLKGSLVMEQNDDMESIDPSAQVLGELGVLHLSRREYTEALDALLRAGFWMDAAYVAERVLTAGELQAYVDRYWPASDAPAPNEVMLQYSRKSMRAEIRYLLARRLARLHVEKDIRAYYPAEWQPRFDQLKLSLDLGRDASLPLRNRAAALMSAAFITRTNGMELLGTECEPDWHIYDGSYEFGISIAFRTNANTQLAVPDPDEIRRAASETVKSNKRYHYRFEAAELAVEAANLLPDNSDETARVLCVAGSWIKNLDPQTANPIYKALVKRCGHTALGKKAARRHWFPALDDPSGSLMITNP